MDEVQPVADKAKKSENRAVNQKTPPARSHQQHASQETSGGEIACGWMEKPLCTFQHAFLIMSDDIETVNLRSYERRDQELLNRLEQILKRTLSTAWSRNPIGKSGPPKSDLQSENCRDMFEDQHLKTAVALIESRKVCYGKYPDSLRDFTGQCQIHPRAFR
jgi:hypothetical protein